MTETNEQTQYRVFRATGVDGSAAWPDASSRPPRTMRPMHRDRAAGDDVSEDDRRAMDRYGITHQHKTVYTYKAYVYDRLADALAYARIDSARVGG